MAWRRDEDGGCAQSYAKNMGLYGQRAGCLRDNMSLDVTQVLLSAQSADGAIRKHAEESLKQFQEQNLPGFLLSLSSELASEEKPEESRRLAGLILKNVLSMDIRCMTWFCVYEHYIVFMYMRLGI